MVQQQQVFVDTISLDLPPVGRGMTSFSRALPNLNLSNLCFDGRSEQ